MNYINTKQSLYTIFENSVKQEIEEKKKSPEMWGTEKWKHQHKLERMKKRPPVSSRSDAQKNSMNF